LLINTILPELRLVGLLYIIKQHVSALHGHHQVLSVEVSLYKLRENRNPFHAIYIAKPQLIKPDDGHIRPKHVVLLKILRIYILYIIYVLCL